MVGSLCRGYIYLTQVKDLPGDMGSTAPKQFSLGKIVHINVLSQQREETRTLLYTNWMKNRGQLKDLVAAEMSSKGELNKSDDKVVYQGNAYLDRSGKISKSGDDDSCLESTPMLDIPQSNQELELDCLNVTITNTKSDRNLNDAINLPSISNGEFNFNLGEWENIAMLQGNLFEGLDQCL